MANTNIDTQTTDRYSDLYTESAQRAHSVKIRYLSTRRGSTVDDAPSHGATNDHHGFRQFVLAHQLGISDIVQFLKEMQMVLTVPVPLTLSASQPASTIYRGGTGWYKP